MKLSPLNFSGLVAARDVVAPAKPKGVTRYLCHRCDAAHRTEHGARNCCRPSSTTRYECPVCGGDEHDEEIDATACCGGNRPHACPICDAGYVTAYEASDCCLWKDVDAPTRHAMAAQVDAGVATWLELLRA